MGKHYEDLNYDYIEREFGFHKQQEDTDRMILSSNRGNTYSEEYNPDHLKQGKKLYKYLVKELDKNIRVLLEVVDEWVMITMEIKKSELFPEKDFPFKEILRYLESRRDEIPYLDQAKDGHRTKWIIERDVVSYDAIAGNRFEFLLDIREVDKEWDRLERELQDFGKILNRDVWRKFNLEGYEVEHDFFGLNRYEPYEGNGGYGRINISVPYLSFGGYRP